MGSVVLQLYNFTPYILVFNRYVNKRGGDFIPNSDPASNTIPIGLSQIFSIGTGDTSGWLEFSPIGGGDKLFVAASNPTLGVNKVGVSTTSGEAAWNSMSNRDYETFTLPLIFNGIVLTAYCKCTNGSSNEVIVGIVPGDAGKSTGEEKTQCIVAMINADPFFLQDHSAKSLHLESGVAVGYYRPGYAPPENAGALSVVCKFKSIDHAITCYHFMHGNPLCWPPGKNGVCIGEQAVLMDSNRDYCVYRLIDRQPVSPGVLGVSGRVNWALPPLSAGMNLRGYGRKSGPMQFQIDAMAWTDVPVIKTTGGARPQPGDSGTLLLDDNNNAVAYLIGYSPLAEFFFGLISFDFAPSRFTAASLPMLIPRMEAALGKFSPIV